MGAQLRVYRRRIRSVQATKKITKAMELISAARIIKAQQRVEASYPYTKALVQAIETAASYARTDHPLVLGKREQGRAAVLVITSDRGLAGAYSPNVLKRGTALHALLRSEGKEILRYVVGRKGASFYRFRHREVAGEWTGFSDNPSYSHAEEIAKALIEKYLLPLDQGGVDEIHVVYTNYRSMVSQEARARRILPLVVEDSQATGVAADVENLEWEGETFPLYEFEPSPEAVLDALLPRYVANLIYNAMLLSAASEHASRRRAMKAATDNAEELIKTLTRQANAARQAEITQEISEIVGGANALAGA